MVQDTHVTLYFIAGRKPTAADTARAAKIPGIVKFRNIDFDDPNSSETADFVTAAPNVTIPTRFNSVTRYSTEEPLSLVIVPDNWSIDLSDTEHADLRAIAHFSDGSTTDVTTLCAWLSSVTAKATVGAATGIVTPLEAGATVITATYNFAAPGEAGAVYASGEATFATPPDIGDTFTVGDIVYTWATAPVATNSATAVQVKIEATAADMARNMIRAINGGPDVPGEDAFSSDAPVNPKVGAAAHASNPLKVVLTARAPGTAPNSYATTQTGDEMTFGAATLASGANASGSVSDTTPLTVVA